MNEYAVYKGEQIRAIGTARDIAKELNVKVETVRHWATPTNNKRNKGKRTVAVKLEEDE